MGLFDKILGMGRTPSASAEATKQPEPVAMQAEQGIVCAPVSGTAIPIEEVPDEAFASKVLGHGCGIKPESEIVYAPVDGVISVTMPHAIGLLSDDGVELLIHVGLDTVAMNGKGFTSYVQQGAQVKAGAPLLGFSKQDIAAAGYQDIIVVVITNSSDYDSVELIPDANSSVAVGAQLIRVK